MGRTKTKAPKTVRATNEQIESEVLNPIITAGIVTVKPDSVPLTEDEIKRLNIRKKLELDLIKQYDKTTITLHECWFIIDSNWLNQWSEFVHSTDENMDNMPDKITTKSLFDENGKLLKGLKCKIDFRAVPPIVYFIFTNLYGRDKSPEIARYLIDIYGIDVDLPLSIKVRYSAQKKAACLVNEIRPQWVSWEIYDEEEEDKSCCWGYITKEHLEAFIYWAVRCWASRSSDRKNIKYSQYRPLRGKDDSPDETPASMDRHGDVEMGQVDAVDNRASSEIDTSTELADRDYDPGVWFRRWLFRG